MSVKEPLIFIVSGETSGDNLAGRLMAALKAATGGRVRFAGIGGPQSEAQGLTSLFPMRELSVMGLAEVLPHLPRLIKRLNQTAETALALKPDAVVTVDLPGFCLRLADRLHDSGIPIVHYVAPQLWAWRPGRARKLATRVDQLMVLLPFEVAVLRRLRHQEHLRRPSRHRIRFWRRSGLQGPSRASRRSPHSFASCPAAGLARQGACCRCSAQRSA